MSHAYRLSSLTLKSQHYLQEALTDPILSVKTEESVRTWTCLAVVFTGAGYYTPASPCPARSPPLITLCFFVEYGDIDQETALAAAHGFTGCLSAVQFSHVAPLKAALHPSHPAPVTVTGHVTESSCVAPAGTDATSRERTHSFAGKLRLFPSSVTNGLVHRIWTIS